MPLRENATDEWRDALSSAAGTGRPIQLFVERREDARLEYRSDAGWATTRTCTTGLAATDLVERRRQVYRAAPRPSDVEAVARAAATGGEPETGEFHGITDPDMSFLAPQERLARKALERVAHATVGILPSAILSGRAIVSRQKIHVARGGQDCLADTRSAVRIRVAARYRRGPVEASAVVEAALHRRATAFKSESLDAMAVRLASRVERRLEARSIPAGRYPVVLAPGVGGVLIHEVVGHALEADSGRSWLSRLADEAVAPAELVVVDDPRVGRAAWRIDDEGVASRPTALIRGGRVAGKLHDRQTARRDGAEPTGHGRRSSFREPVLPRMGCTFVGAGSFDPRELIQETRTGIYVHRLEAGHVDIDTSQAVFRVTDADRIVAGRTAGPLEPFMMIVNGRQALAGLTRVGRDLSFDTCIGSCHREGQPLSISVGSPTICIGVAGVVG